MAVEFLPAAEQELGAASAFYEQQREGLGRGLIDEVQAICGLIAEYPSMGRKVDQIHRCIPLRRYPFFLFYRATGSLMLVVAVAHKRKRPGYWRSRLESK